jgi:glycosyltransferase involved in cell wall biosynthesis
MSALALVGPAYPLRGGIAQYTTMLYRELALHHDVTYVSYSRQYPGLLFPGKTQLDVSRTHLAVPCEALVDSVNPLSWRRAADRSAAARARLAVLIWWHPFFAPALGSIARALAARGVPVAYLCHNVAPHESSRLTRVLSRWAFAPARAFVVHASELARPLAELAPAGARIRASPHPLYDQFGPPPPADRARAALGITSERVLLFFGLVRAYKGVTTLLHAFAALAAADPGVTLVVAGECYEPEAGYRSLVSELGLEARVRFENRFIPNEEVATYFAAADVVVLPYLAASQSGVIPIAYAMDRPVVATRVGGLPEVVFEDETGYLVPPGDPAALAAAVTRVFARGGRAAFAPGIARHRDLFSWSRMRGVIEELVGY